MPPINGDTVPGNVTLPLWVLIVAIVVLFGVREVERRAWFQKLEAATKSIDAVATSVESLVKMVETVFRQGGKL